MLIRRVATIVPPSDSSMKPEKHVSSHFDTDGATQAITSGKRKILIGEQRGHSVVPPVSRDCRSYLVLVLPHIVPNGWKVGSQECGKVGQQLLVAHAKFV